jgi:hypothetical protein
MTTGECIKYDCLVDMGIATAEEINLVRNCMAGSWNEVLDAILYARTGYNSIEQMTEAEDEE